MKTNLLLEILLLAAILSIAAFFRVYRLDELPPGLHYDEAFNATMAQRVLSGVERPLFFREDLTEEPMAIYTTALVFALFGESAWSLRLTSALAGIAGVFALYAFARVLFPARGIAALAALVLATLYWHVNFSRLGMEPIFAPLTMTLCVLFLWRGLSPSKVQRPMSEVHRPEFGVRRRMSLVTRHPSLAFVLAGIFLAATQYTYKAALVFPLFVAAFLITEILADQTILSRLARPFALFALFAFLAFLPLGLYFAAHPDDFFQRPSTVTIVAAGVAPILDNVKQVGAMFFLRGDANPRSNLPDRPALDAFLALGFLVGLSVCARNLRRSESRLLLLWLAFQLLPTLLTDYAPHFGRAIGATPAVALIVAGGFAAIWRKASSAKPEVTWLPFTGLCFLSAGMAFSAFTTYRDYFDMGGARTGLFDSFDVGILQVGQKLRAMPADTRVYVSPVEADHYTLRFGLAGRPAASFDGRHALVLAPGNAVYAIFTREDPRTLARLERIFPSGAVVERVYDFAAQPRVALFRASGLPQVEPQHSVRAKLGDEIELWGYDLARDGNALALTLYWRARAETRTDYTVFAQLTGALNPATQSPVWAQDDAKPGHAAYPTPRWRAGEIIVDDYHLMIPDAAPRGDYQIEMGMYILETGARVRVTDASGARMENDRVVSIRLSLP